MKDKVVLITGASSGIGLAIAKLLLKNNYIVYGSARSTDKMSELQASGGSILDMDVTSDLSVSDGVNTIVKEHGRIDILVNNAGYGLYGALENVAIEEAKKQLDVNVFGLARVIQCILPVMRAQKEGKIINISSIAGKLTSPMGSWYFASKHAVEGLSDSLRQELKPFGIDVIIIEPGGVKSGWADIAANHLTENSKDTPYYSQAKKVTTKFPFIKKENANPEVIANLILKSIIAKNPKTRYIGGANAKFFLFARKILSDKLFDKVVLTQYK